MRYPSFPGDTDDNDRRLQILFLARLLLLYLADNIHAPYDFPEGCEALAIGIPLPAEIEFWLVTNADEYL